MGNIIKNSFMIFLFFFFIIWSAIGMCVFFDREQYRYNLMSIFGKIIFNFCSGPLIWIVYIIYYFIYTPIIFILNLNFSKRLFTWIKKCMYKSTNLDSKSKSIDW